MGKIRKAIALVVLYAFFRMSFPLLTSFSSTSAALTSPVESPAVPSKAARTPVVLDPPMKMTFVPPNEELLRRGGPAFWRMYLDGVIDSEAASRFVEQANRRGAGGASLVFLNSPGGDLATGVALGEAIRRLGMSTYVAAFTPRSWAEQDDAPGICASACVLSYAGGDFRYQVAGSQIGVHRFYNANPNPVPHNGMDQAQIASAHIVTYLQRMDVDAELFSEMASASPDEMKWLSKERIESLNLANNGRKTPRWQIDSLTVAPYSLFLRGGQTSFVSIGQIIFECTAEGIKFTPLYLAREYAQEIVNLSFGYALRVNEKFFPLAQGRAVLRVNKIDDENYLTGHFLLDKETSRLLVGAKSIGFAAFPQDEKLFWGFDVDIRTKNDEKIIIGYVQNCLNGVSENSASTLTNSFPDIDKTINIKNVNWDHDKNIGDAVANAIRSFESGGISRLYIDVENCYRSLFQAVKNSTTGKSAEYCVALDFIGFKLDFGSATAHSWPQQPYFLWEAVSRRNDKAIMASASHYFNEVSIAYVFKKAEERLSIPTLPRGNSKSVRYEPDGLF